MDQVSLPLFVRNTNWSLTIPPSLIDFSAFKYLFFVSLGMQMVYLPFLDIFTSFLYFYLLPFLSLCTTDFSMGIIKVLSLTLPVLSSDQWLMK